MDEENSCPCHQKADLKGQPLAFSAFPVPACVSPCQRWQRGPGTRPWALAGHIASPGLGSGPSRWDEGLRHRALSLGTVHSAHHTSPATSLRACVRCSLWRRSGACPLGAETLWEMWPPAAPSVKGGSYQRSTDVVPSTTMRALHACLLRFSATPSVKGGSYQRSTDAVPSTTLRALHALSPVILRARLLLLSPLYR